MQQIRCQLGERTEHETVVEDIGTRQMQPGLVDHGIVIEQKVDIESP